MGEYAEDAIDRDMNDWVDRNPRFRDRCPTCNRYSGCSCDEEWTDADERIV